MRRGLARLLSAGELQHRFERRAHELELQAIALEEEAGPRKRRPARTPRTPGRC
jgi:hypothetical protein